MHNKAKTKDIAFLGICVTLALGLAYVETLLEPLFTTIPGIKMGLPNIVLVFLLYRRGVISASTVSLLRLVLLGLLFGNFTHFLYGLAGGVLSMAVMALLKRLHFLSVTGVSVAGAVTHNMGQILMAILLTRTTAIAYYFVILAVTGTIAGIFIGLAGALLIRRIPNKWC